MISLLRKLAIGTLLRIRWRAQPQRLAQTLGKFADVEADSAWHYSVAADLLEQPARRAEMMLTALEEIHHAYLFERLAARHGMVAKRNISRKRLINSADDLPGFLAYAQIAEGTIHSEFDALAEASGDEEAKAIIHTVSEDESAHEEDAMGLLLQLTTKTNFRSALRRARLRRFYDDWMEVVRSIGAANALLWLGAIYVILGWIGRTSCRRRLAQSRAVDIGGSASLASRRMLLPQDAGIAA